jgi:hypothetical protein
MDKIASNAVPRVKSSTASLHLLLCFLESAAALQAIFRPLLSGTTQSYADKTIRLSVHYIHHPKNSLAEYVAGASSAWELHGNLRGYASEYLVLAWF